MSWLPRLQQRLNITKNEALTLLSLSLFLLVGTAGRYACRQMTPVSAEYYAELDSLFAARSAAALEAAEGAHADSKSRKRSDEAGVVNPVQGSASAAQRMVGDSTAIQSATSGRDGRSQSTYATTLQGESSVREAATGEGAAPFTIDINRATAEELDRLPRVGPRIAERIVEFRRNYGPFRSVDELVSVRGIGATTLELIRPHARIEQVQEGAVEGAGTATNQNTSRADSTKQRRSADTIP